MKSGEHAVDFELTDQYGQLQTLSHLLSQGPVVLFFYPSAGSASCTQEARHFRDQASNFAKAGAQMVGISMDSVEDQSSFARDNNLGFPLLADVDGGVAEAFGVRRRLLSKVLPVKRSTFVINPDFSVRAVISSETNMATHADVALAALLREEPEPEPAPGDADADGTQSEASDQPENGADPGVDPGTDTATDSGNDPETRGDGAR